MEFRHAFNFSEKNNVGALHATGEVLVFLNDDMEAISPGVIENLIAPLREPGVGATGPKLLFEGSRVQHAGLVYGSGTITHSYYRAAHPDVVGAYGELWINREVTALTGACIAVPGRSSRTSVGSPRSCRSTTTTSTSASSSCTPATGWCGCTTCCSTTSSRSPDPTRCGPWEKRFITDRWGDYLEVEERFSINVR